MEEINANKEPIYIMSIELETGITDKIIVYKDSKPEELAYYFCHRNNLDFTGLKILIEKISLLKKLKTLTSNEPLQIKTYKESEKNKNNIPKINNKYIRSQNNDNLILNKKYIDNFSVKDTNINNKSNTTCSYHEKEISNNNFVIGHEKYLDCYLKKNNDINNEKLYDYLFKNTHKNILNYDYFFNQFKKKTIPKNKKLIKNLKKINQNNKYNLKLNNKIDFNSNLRTSLNKIKKAKKNSSFLSTTDKKYKNYINIYTFNKSNEKRSQSRIKNNSFKICYSHYKDFDNSKNNSTIIKNYKNYNEITPINRNKLKNYLINISKDIN